MSGPAFGNNNVDTCAAGLPLPHRIRPEADIRHIRRHQDFKSVDSSDVIVVIGANPTAAHPVFASRMKRRIRAEGQAHRDRPAPHRDRPFASRRGGLPSPGVTRANVAVMNAWLT